MIIEIEKNATILDRKADAILMVVDSAGKDVTGLLKNWLDISQVIEMMALCKELGPAKVLDFELETAHLYVITKDDVQASLAKVFELAKSHDVSSINIPDIEDVSIAVWGMESSEDILVRLCQR